MTQLTNEVDILFIYSFILHIYINFFLIDGREGGANFNDENRTEHVKSYTDDSLNQGTVREKQDGLSLKYELA